MIKRNLMKEIRETLKNTKWEETYIQELGLLDHCREILTIHDEYVRTKNSLDYRESSTKIINLLSHLTSECADLFIILSMSLKVGLIEERLEKFKSKNPSPPEDNKNDSPGIGCPQCEGLATPPLWKLSDAYRRGDRVYLNGKVYEYVDSIPSYGYCPDEPVGARKWKLIL